MALVAGLVVVTLIALAGGGVVANRVAERAADDEGQAPVAAPAPGDLTTYLVVGTVPGAAGVEARWMTVIGVDKQLERASILYLPASTAYEVPGRGLQGIGDSLASGGISLVKVSAENLLGFAIDHYIELPSTGARSLFEQTGELTVNVPAEVTVEAGAGQTRVLFSPGEQILDARFQTELLYEAGVDGDQGALGQRHVSFWQAFVDAHAGDPDQLGAAVGAVSGALANSNASNDQQVELFTELVSTPTPDVTIAALPVSQEVVGDAELYSTDDDEVRAFLEDAFGTLPPIEDEVRVQILNGNGVPGIGERVADALIGEGFRVVLSGNAESLDVTTTRIVAYESTPEAEASAQRAAELLGVGEVQVSVQQQGIVDLTIVVGKDFIDATDADSD